MPPRRGRGGLTSNGSRRTPPILDDERRRTAQTHFITRVEIHSQDLETGTHPTNLSFLVDIADKDYADTWKQHPVSNVANKRFRSRLALVVEEMKILLVYWHTGMIFSFECIVFMWSKQPLCRTARGSNKRFIANTSKQAVLNVHPVSSFNGPHTGLRFASGICSQEPLKVTANLSSSRSATARWSDVSIKLKSTKVDDISCY